jgi:hypothetical protein
MSEIHDRFAIAGSKSRWAVDQVIEDECCPTTAGLMAGVCDPKTGFCLIEEASITIFRDNGVYKVVMGRGPACRRFYLTLDGLEAVVEQVERALNEGQGTWRDPVAAKPRLTKLHVNGTG